MLGMISACFGGLGLAIAAPLLAFPSMGLGVLLVSALFAPAAGCFGAIGLALGVVALVCYAPTKWEFGGVVLSVVALVLAAIEHHAVFGTTIL